MTTAKRRRGHSLHLELPGDTANDPPPVAALFLILFDSKAGYTIAWKQSILNLELAESVEFKSLPSGLHNVEKDTVYFLHNDQYAGLSAFRNRSAASEDRNALMLAVGVLVSLGDGRLGRAWRHKEDLERLASTLSEKLEDRTPLENFWQQHRFEEEERDSTHEDSPATSPPEPVSKTSTNEYKPSNGTTNSHRRIESSGSGLLLDDRVLKSSNHPATAIPNYFELFGPLIFPLYRASLLRKRVLFVGDAPVEEACNLTYILSLLSTLPSHTESYIPLEPLPLRQRALFSVGIHDISILSRGGRSSLSQKGEGPSDPSDPGFGWVACTTDDILAHKPELWDVLVTLPPQSSRQNMDSKIYPKLKDSRGSSIRATQRDLRRWITLRQTLALHTKAAARPVSSSTARTTASPSPFTLASSQLPNSDTRNRSSRPSTSSAGNLLDAVSGSEPPITDDIANIPSLGDNPDEVVEPQTWSALAYTSFFWWASAGEERTDLDEEAAHDAELMTDVLPDARSSGLSMNGNEVAVEDDDDDDDDEEEQDNRQTHVDGGSTIGGSEIAIIKYFHRLSSLMFTTLANIADSEEDSEDDGDEEELPPRERYRDEPLVGQNEDTEAAPLLQEQATRDGENTAVIHMTRDDLTTLGLDVYSAMDREFAEEMVALYWGREAEVAAGRWTGGDGEGLDICGLRIC